MVRPGIDAQLDIPADLITRADEAEEAANQALLEANNLSGLRRLAEARRKLAETYREVRTWCALSPSLWRAMDLASRAMAAEADRAHAHAARLDAYRAGLGRGTGGDQR